MYPSGRAKNYSDENESRWLRCGEYRLASPCLVLLNLTTSLIYLYRARSLFCYAYVAVFSFVLIALLLYNSGSCVISLLS